MAKKRKMSSSAVSKRIPPSVPKCVTRCADGYCTDFFKANGKSLKLIFRKVPSGYLVYRQSDDACAKPVCMSTDISVAPTTRTLFSNLSTLSKAIDAAENWLGMKLPDVR